MRRLLLTLLVGVLVLSNAGCLINALSADPTLRMQALLNWSEDLRQIEAEMSRFWFTDQPSHMTYERVHGGIQ
jgi:hypothetical protein